MKNKVISREYVEKNYISIKELKKVLDIEEYDHIDVLSHISTLMSEVDRLEDIEDYIAENGYYNMGFDKGVKCVKDQLKELIKEKAKTDTYNFKTIAVKDIEEVIKYLEKFLVSGQESDQEGGQENE